MVVLSDSRIREELEEGELEVTPVSLEEQLQPNSLDIRLNDSFSRLESKNSAVLDPEQELVEYEDYIDYTVDEYTIIGPGEFLLADTVEDFYIPDDIYAQLHGRSSIGRLGIEVHSTAGLVDAGYSGSITLELKNNLDRPVRLYTGMRIAQVVFHELDSPAEQPYSGKTNKYQNQSDVVHSRLNEEL